MAEVTVQPCNANSRSEVMKWRIKLQLVVVSVAIVWVTQVSWGQTDMPAHPESVLGQGLIELGKHFERRRAAEVEEYRAERLTQAQIDEARERTRMMELTNKKYELELEQKRLELEQMRKEQTREDTPVSQRETYQVPFDKTYSRPTASQEVQTRNKQFLTWPDLEMKGVSKVPDGKYRAILIGIGVVEAGDVVKMERDGVIYRWKINAITEKGLSHTQMDARRVATPPSSGELDDME